MFVILNSYQAAQATKKEQLVFSYLCNLLICLLLQKQVTYQDSAKKEEKIKHKEQTSSNLLTLHKGAQTYLFHRETC